MDRETAGDETAGDGTADPGGASRARPVWRDPLLVLAAFVASRVVVHLSAVVATWYGRGLSVTAALTSWDAAWYLRIARLGYPATVAVEGAAGNRWGFFPAVPGLVRAVHALTPLGWATSSVVAGLLAGALAVLAVHLAVRDVLGDRVAVATATLVCFLPLAYVFSMAYTEGVFLACAALCLWALGRRRWALAGVAALVGGVTRSTGMVLLLCCAVEGVRMAVVGRSLRPLLAPALAPLGLAAFAFAGWRRTGEPLAWVRAQETWDNRFEWYRPVLEGMGRLVTQGDAWHDPKAVLFALGLTAAVVGGLALWRVGPVPLVWWVYTAGAVAVALTPSSLSSIPRFLLPAFPLVAGLVAWLPDRARPVAVGASAVLLGALAMGAFLSVTLYPDVPLVP